MLITCFSPEALPARQVGLRDVAGHDRLRAEADARQEHLHLLDRGVLRLVENDERIVERAAAHERERRDLDDVALDEARDAIEAQHLVERVVHRPQVRIDLLREIARQEAEPLAGLDRRPHQHDAPHAIGLQRLDRAGDGQVGLARAGRADAEREIVARGCCARYSRWLRAARADARRDACAPGSAVLRRASASRRAAACVMPRSRSARCTRSGVTSPSLRRARTARCSIVLGVAVQRARRPTIGK